MTPPSDDGKTGSWSISSSASDPTRVRTLSDADAEAVETVIARRLAGARTGPVAPGQNDRVLRAERVLALLEAYPVEDPSDDLVQKTIAGVHAARQRERFQQQVEMLTRPEPTLGVGWRQVLAAAAVFLLAASLLMPVLERNRQDAQQAASMANLGSAGVGLASYATAWQGVMPQRKVKPGSVWWNVGAPVDEDGYVHSNSANLYTLVRGGYVDVQQLSSPANVDAPRPGELTPADHDWRRPSQISYSYQNQFTPYTLRIADHSKMVVMATKNPLFVVKSGKLCFNAEAAPTTASRMYGGRGQHLLFANGAVVWQLQPVYRDRAGRTDAIYAVEGHTGGYTGVEQPARAGDSFLVP